MKKKLTSEKEFSEGFDQAIEKDRQKNPEAYKENAVTFRDYIVANKKSVSAIGAKGGHKPKMNKSILTALDVFFKENQNLSEMQNGEILRRFKRKIKSSPIKVTIDGQPFEISLYVDDATGHDKIISTPTERYDGKKANIPEKEIACSTFLTHYIPLVKKISSKIILNKLTHQNR